MEKSSEDIFEPFVRAELFDCILSFGICFKSTRSGLISFCLSRNKSRKKVKLETFCNRMNVRTSQGKTEIMETNYKRTKETYRGGKMERNVFHLFSTNLRGTESSSTCFSLFPFATIGNLGRKG